MSVTAAHSTQDASDINLSYCRAAIYSALALGFLPPSGETLSRLLTDESRACLARAAALLHPDRAPALISRIDGLSRADDGRSAALGTRYRLLFGHTARGEIAPYETEYGNEALFQQPQELGDLMGFYHAFGLAMKAGQHERPDHISCEFEFLMFLALKEAYGLERNDRDMVAETRKAEKLFMRDHLGRFLPAFAGQIERADAGGFYASLGEFCREFIAAEAARLQVALGAANLGLRPADDSRVPMACGSGTECAAMPGADMPEGAESP